MTAPSSDSELDRILEELYAFGYQDGLENIRQDHPHHRAQAKSAILAWNKQRVEAAEERGVAWAIKEIDDMHMNTPSGERFESDKLFKGIKNSLRDRYKLHTGSDPAPSYPVRAELTKRAESQEISR